MMADRITFSILMHTLFAKAMLFDRDPNLSRSNWSGLFI